MSDIYTLHRLTITAPGEQLFAALSAAIPGLTRSKARETCMAGLVTVDKRLIREAKTELQASHRVEVDLRHGIKRALHARIGGNPAPAAMPFTIVYQDADVLVVDKAAGILSAPNPKKGMGEKVERGHLPELVRRALRKQGRELDYMGIVHRLDKDTSGCIVFALTREAQRILQTQFVTHSAGRTYRAMVMGQPRQDEDTLHGKLGHREDGRRAVVDEDDEGKEAVTHFKVVKRLAQGADLEVRLETGRTHQIRIMLYDIGCPLYGDTVYAFKPRKNQVPPPRAPRLMLHAAQLAFDHPMSGKRIVAVAPLPREFAEFALVLNEPAAVSPWAVNRSLDGALNYRARNPHAPE